MKSEIKNCLFVIGFTILAPSTAMLLIASVISFSTGCKFYDITQSGAYWLFWGIFLIVSLIWSSIVVEENKARK